MNIKNIVLILSIIINSTCVVRANDVIIDSLLNDAHLQRQTCPECAISNANEVIHLCGDSLPKKQALAYRRIGTAESYQENFEKAIINYQKAFEIDSESDYKIGQVASLNFIGNVYKAQREYDQAVKVYVKSLKIGETIDIFDELGDTYNSLASIFSIRKDFYEAKKYFEKARKVREKRNDTLRLASTYQDMGNLYARMDSLDTALDYYIESEKLHKIADNKNALGQTYNNLGGMYFRKGDIENAIEYFKKSLLIKKELSDNRGVAVTTYNICELYYNEKKYKQAISHCNESIEYAQPLKDYRVLNSAEFMLYKIAKARNKPEEALGHHEKHARWKDSLDVDKKDIEIQKIIGKYEKDKKVAKLEEENRLQKIRYIATILFTLMAIGGLIFYSITKKKLHEEEKKRRIKEEELHKETEGRRIEGEKLHRQVIKNLEQNAEIQAANTEIDAKLKERTKISSELHDTVCSGLVSAKLHLESVQNKIAEKDQATFAKGLYLLDDAYTTCREISHELNPPMLEKFGLSQAIEDICEKLTTPETDIQFGATQFDERLTQQQELTLYQSIQELLQNILKHSAASEAHVQLTDYDDSLNILVEDNGRGFDTAEISEGGIGLQRIRTRVKHLGGSMDVDSSLGNGTTVIIDVPKSLSTHEIST